MADYSLVSKDLNRIISEGVKALFKNYFKITSEKINIIHEKLNSKFNGYFM